ncbi:MAG: DUF4157 domain-containing protein [Actinomycetota bacterium]
MAGRRGVRPRSEQKRRIEKRDGYRLFVGAPVPAQADAITLGSLICVRKAHADNDALLAHELVHVHQYQALGWGRFLVRYSRSYLRGRLSGYGHMAAYRRIPLEVEAVWLSRLHGRAALEPGSAEPTPEGLSQARSPRSVSSQRLHDRAEDLGWKPPPRTDGSRGRTVRAAARSRRPVGGAADHAAG